MRDRAEKFRNYKIAKVQNSSRGYILITLMLFLTLLAITAMAVLPEIALQIKRDREEEMIHRAVGYSRAIRKYYKKFGRYPSRVEDLENTNNLRFLRKRYKDPLTDKDFKLLRMGDPALALGGFGSGLGQGLNPAQGLGANRNLGGGAGGGIQPAGSTDANVPQVTGLPQQQQKADTQNQTGGDSGAGDGKANSKTADSSDSGSSLGSQVFGGGPILGVTSLSKAKTIREFSKKNRYNEWLFIYDPTSDRGGLLTGPTQPGTGQGFSAAGQSAPGQGTPNAGPGGTPPQIGPTPGQQPPEE